MEKLDFNSIINENYVDQEGTTSEATETFFEERSEKKEDESQSQMEEVSEDATYKRPAFAYWTVGSNTFKLKLKSSNITVLEDKYNKSLLALLGSDEGLPKLSIMLDVTFAAMQPWYHGLKYESVVKLYDQYIEAGGSQLDFYKEVYMDIYKASGFFTKEMIQNMSKNLK